MPHLVDINDKRGRVLDVRMSRIVELIGAEAQHLQWSLLYLYAAGDLGEGKSIGEFEREIYDAPFGNPMAWKEVVSLAQRLSEVYHIILVASTRQPRISRADDDLVMYTNSEMVLELFDSSFWRIYAKDEAVINRVMTAFEKVEVQDHLLKGEADETSDP